MSQFARILYQGIFKRSPTILLFAVVGAIFVEEGIDFTGTYIFRRINEGRLWEDVKHKYIEKS